MLIYVFHNLRLESVDDIVFHIPHRTHSVVFSCFTVLPFDSLWNVYICMVDGYNKRNNLLRNAYSRRVQNISNEWLNRSKRKMSISLCRKLLVLVWLVAVTFLLHACVYDKESFKRFSFIVTIQKIQHRSRFGFSYFLIFPWISHCWQCIDCLFLYRFVCCIHGKILFSPQDHRAWIV